MTSQKSILNPISVLLLVVLGLFALLGSTGRDRVGPDLAPLDGHPTYGTHDQVVTRPGGVAVAS